MKELQSYERIHGQLSKQLAVETTETLGALLQQALRLTEESRESLRVLRQQRPGLLARVGAPAPDAVGILESAAKLIEAKEAHQVFLEKRLQDIERAASEPAEEDTTSPELREELRESLGEPVELPASLSDPAEITRQIEKIAAEKRQIVETAFLTVEVASKTESWGRIVFATANLWLDHTLQHRIYDTDDTEFEASIRRERISETTSWAVGQALGLIPIAGVVVGTLDFSKRLRSLRQNLWTSTRKTVQFLEEYSTALQAWNAAFLSHQERLRDLESLTDS